MTEIGLPGDLLDRIIGRLRKGEPDSVAIVVTGSYARGAARDDSDLDITAFTPSPVIHYRTWFEEREGAMPLHVSAGAVTLDEWLEDAPEPASWALGFPAINKARYVWRAEPTLDLPDPPSVVHPHGPPEVEDFVETIAKAKSLARSGDVLGFRWAAHDAALYVPATLLRWNQERLVTDPRDALDAALSLAVAPVHYREDVITLLGLRPARDDEMLAAVNRMARELLGFLRGRAEQLEAQPGTVECLTDGTFERHLGLLD